MNKSLLDYSAENCLFTFNYLKSAVITPIKKDMISKLQESDIIFGGQQVLISIVKFVNFLRTDFLDSKFYPQKNSISDKTIIRN